MIKKLKLAGILFGIINLININAQNIQNNKNTNLDEEKIEKISQIIYIIEGKNQTKWPYGVKIKFKGNRLQRESSAREYCKKLVIQHYNEWVKLETKKPFWSYLASKYCTNEHPIDLKHWCKNYVFYAKKMDILF